MILKLIRKILRMLSRFTVVLFILFIAAVAAFVWSYMNYQKAKSQLAAQGTQQMSEQQVSRLIRAVGKHMILPEGNPTVAVIQDATALEGQLFFKNAQNGDVVLVYADQAIIYNPKSDMLVNVGPVIKDPNTSATSSATTEATTQTSVEVRNGSATVGRAGTIGDEIEALGGFTVSTTTNAKDKKYAKTVIVNLGNKDVTALETKFGVKAVTALPAGEVTSKADVVVILGNE